MRNSLIIIGMFGLLFSACTPVVEQLKEEGVDKVEEVQQQEDASSSAKAMEDKEEKEIEEIKEVKDGGSYDLYREGVVGQGEKVVLFFHAAWCPYCIQNDARLEKFYAEAEVPLSTYRIDFDTADALKQKYSVGKQDTFLLLDESGQELKRISFPSEQDLKRLVYGNVNAAQ